MSDWNYRIVVKTTEDGNHCYGIHEVTITKQDWQITVLRLPVILLEKHEQDFKTMLIKWQKHLQCPFFTMMIYLRQWMEFLSLCIPLRIKKLMLQRNKPDL